MHDEQTKQYSIPEDQWKDIQNRFIYHSPKERQAERYAEMRELAKKLALQIASGTPKSREQSVALTKLDEVVFWANAAIARNE